MLGIIEVGAEIKTEKMLKAGLIIRIQMINLIKAWKKSCTNKWIYIYL